ncbi:MAG: hydroxyacid dehydrogenase [Robiginitomaculum sp.]|nr:MAG: hydroxyacid dehydrogenase [Robiginitomaculum sp.]
MSIAQTITELKAALPGKSWTQDTDKTAPFLSEWRGRWHGETPLLLLPTTTNEVATAVKICARYKTPITVQGGNTGLVGGQIPQGEILLSTVGLNKIRETDKANMQMICEAGVTLQAAQTAADNMGLKFPLSLASEGSCSIGGNLATNAGGVHVVKYGTARALTFGVEAVLADGSVFAGLTSLHKDNTGIDLSQVLIGAEGTLGIITAASLKLLPKPKEIIRAMAAVESPEQALTLLSHVRSGDLLSMFELIPRLGLEYVTDNMAGHKDPFLAPHPWYVLVEWEFYKRQASHTGGENPQDFAENILAQAIDSGLVQDAVIASSQAQSTALLALRENLSAAQKFVGAMIKHDISVPIAKVPDFITRANAAVLKYVKNCRPLPFGHLGDGNIHYNIGQPQNMTAAEFMALEPQINDIVYDIVDGLGGSISAEHGIGILKKSQLARRANPAKLQMMRRIKSVMDPDNILNPRVLL